MSDQRFVILRHEPGETGPRGLHWDLMLEFGDSLRTWAFAKQPSAGMKLAVDELPPHRLRYLDYEGPISEGRGQVFRVDQGTFTVVENSAARLVIELDGATLSEQIEFIHDCDQRWTASIGAR